MEHKESTVIVYHTTEYGRFKMINGNRQLNEPKIKRIIEEITNGNDMLRYYPIQVREKKDRLEILDGQHRFYICKKLKVPVFYIMLKEDKSLPEIAKLNSNVSKWNNADYINCFVQHGDENYVILQEFHEKYGMANSVCLRLLVNGDPGVEGASTSLSDDFRNGLFKVKFLEKATEIAENCKKFEQFPNWRSRAFVIAIYRIMQAGIVTVDEVVKAYHKRPEYLTEQANYKAYVNIIEQMMNVGRQKRLVII